MAHSSQERVKTAQPVFNKQPTNYQSNLFTESRQEFTELEKKIVTLVVNQIGNMAVKNEIEPRMNVLVQIPFLELTKARYDQIANAAESLSKKRLAFRTKDSSEFTFITPFPLVQSAIVSGVRVIEITMLANVVPYFAELGQRYTKYDIDVMLSLSSVYAQRMFEIVSMFYNRGQRQFSYPVSELRTILNCPETYRYNDFTLNALEVAQRELQQKANLHLDWEPSIKQGKRIVELTFSIKTTHQLSAEAIEQDRLVINQMPIHEAIQAAYRLMVNYKLSKNQKDQIIADHELLNSFFRIHVELTKGLRPKVKNHTAYLVKSLGIDQGKKKAAEIPAPELPFTLPASSSTRSGSLQSIAAILGGIQFSTPEETK